MAIDTIYCYPMPDACLITADNNAAVMVDLNRAGRVRKVQISASPNTEPSSPVLLNDLPPELSAAEEETFRSLGLVHAYKLIAARFGYTPERAHDIVARALRDENCFKR